MWFSQAKTLRQPLIALFSANQQLPPHAQVWTVAAGFYLMCEAYQIEPHEFLIKVKNARKAMREYRDLEWEAMIDYIRGEHIDGGYT